ncbi:hypothetical protein A3D71_01780 [Candidatus Kaiserbacteria bacterium RIFCSPHIGHO2_02_FULL_55_20]|uniref:Uncharacterized protein n=1 Tax=Candidatus Kaiserbacteria bacterium RIFCSPHIGHO2_02_FULL_55_20 TaxID=1798497 RepID=A0A1F6DWX0_9BACT|nr:MAG: hypothetical protein A2680_02015 [Candidatus Kaiserbacteria bacterium RIFCSPHIGHO2_01_FULL_55_37]OGG65780.1 MAG: hypothetical protein A3D71_01780 [Candidatus Kaiserbacteria bacterium RIFCSPHIGHO2_02_FULL_55_20]
MDLPEKIPLLSSVKKHGQAMVSEGKRAVVERDWSWLIIWLVIIFAICYSGYLGWRVLHNAAYPLAEPYKSSQNITLYSPHYGGNLTLTLDDAGTLTWWPENSELSLSKIVLALDISPMVSAPEYYDEDLDKQEIDLVTPKGGTKGYLFELPDLRSHTIKIGKRSFVVTLINAMKNLNGGYQYDFTILGN